MKHAVVYVTPTCTYCRAAKSLLAKYGIEYASRDITRNRKFYQELVDLGAAMTVPQIVIDGTLVGGYADLLKFFGEQASAA